MLVKKKRKYLPQRWAEIVVYISAHPNERHDELRDFRKRYFRKALVSTARAKKMARTEAFYWIISAWPERIFHFVRVVMQLILKGAGS